MSEEKRPKMWHSHFASHEDGHEAHGVAHGFDAGSQEKHVIMSESILDYQVLIAGGMGMGAYNSMKAYKIDPIVTAITNIDHAAMLYLDGTLPNLIGRLHLSLSSTQL